MLAYILSCPNKFYVDVGCHHPVRISNTFFLYQTGWTGLCIDANPCLISEFHRVRPKDTAECVCVGEKTGETTFVISQNPALSHVATDHIVQPSATNEDRRVLLSVKTLQQLFEEHDVPKQFGLLSIDVEGSDFAVLRSFDLHKWRPHLILIEIHSLDLERCAESEIVLFLRNAGYKIIGYNTYTAFFSDQRVVSSSANKLHSGSGGLLQ